MSANNHLNIIVSGGSRGLGFATVEGLLADGHTVATFSRKPSDELNRLEESVGKERLRISQIDAADGDALRGFVQACQAEWNCIDALVNNAGLAYDNVLAMMPDEEIERMLDVNLKASLLLAKECSRFMLAQSSGNIINIASIIAERGFRGLSAYAATKAGMIGFTRSLARELGARNIRVNAIAPGYLETGMSESLEDKQRKQIERRTPLGRLGTVDDVVPVIRFLLSDASGFVTGQVLTVDGGASV